MMIVSSGERSAAPSPLRYQVSRYRWVALLSVFPALAVTQMFWLTLSVISSQAVRFYHTTALAIAGLSMAYMVVYIVMSMPAAMLADRKGVRASFTFGAVVTAVFAIARAIGYDSFAVVILTQVGLAIAQPFLLNPITKLAAQWFPVAERATASGIGSIAGYLGIIIALVATAPLCHAYSIGGMLWIFAGIAILAAILVLALLREQPPVPAGPRSEVNDQFSFRDSHLLVRNRNFVRLLVVVCIALGVFNALLTAISDMLSARGFSNGQSGLLGGIIVFAGLGGAIVIPVLSDRLRRRAPILAVAVVLATVGILGLTYVNEFAALAVASALAGFCFMGAGPLVFQFGTEVAYPVPEGTSYGLLMGSGQVSGVLFILLLYGLRGAHGSMTLPMTVLVALMVVALGCSLHVEDSTVIQQLRAERSEPSGSGPKARLLPEEQ